jgi:hypothetical protein
MLKKQKIMITDAINSCKLDKVAILIITDSLLPMDVPKYKTHKDVYTKIMYVKNITDIGRAMYHALGANIIFTDLLSKEYAEIVNFLKPIDISSHTRYKPLKNTTSDIMDPTPITGKRRTRPTTLRDNTFNRRRSDNDPTLGLYYYSTLYAGIGGSNSDNNGGDSSSNSSSSDSGYSNSSSSDSGYSSSSSSSDFSSSSSYSSDFSSSSSSSFSCDFSSV